MNADKKEQDNNELELNKIMDEIDLNDNGNDENEKLDATKDSALIEGLIGAVDGITQVISNHTRLESVRLTEDDKKNLKVAIAPFMNEILKYINLLKYAGIILFMTGYMLRIVSEIETKKKQKKEQEKIMGMNITQTKGDKP